MRTRLARINSHLNEAIQGMRVTQAFVQERENMRFFDHINDDYRQAMNRSSRVADLFIPLVEVTGAVGACIVYWYGARSGDRRRVNSRYIHRLRPVLGAVLGADLPAGQRLQPGAASDGVVRADFRVPGHRTRPWPEKPDAYEMPPIEGRVRLNGVQFCLQAGSAGFARCDLEGSRAR